MCIIKVVSLNPIPCGNTPVYCVSSVYHKHGSFHVIKHSLEKIFAVVLGSEIFYS